MFTERAPFLALWLKNTGNLFGYAEKGIGGLSGGRNAHFIKSLAGRETIGGVLLASLFGLAILSGVSKKPPGISSLHPPGQRART